MAKHFQAKQEPVRVKKMRQIKSLVPPNEEPEI
jgi:hypothetical protein